MLWRKPAFELGDECVDTMISRSSSAPLDVSFLARNVHTLAKAQSLLAKHIHRTQKLNITAAGDLDVYPIMETVLARPARLLATLSLRIVPPVDFSETRMSLSSSDMFSSSAFSGYTPNLTHLTLMGPATLPPLPLFPSITHLTLSQCRQRLSPREVRDLLQAMPRLQSLSLNNALKPGPEPSAQPAIHLPDLAILTVQESVFACRRILAQVRSSLLIRTSFAIDISQDAQPMEYGALLEALIAPLTHEEHGLQTLWLVSYVEDQRNPTELRIRASEVLQVAEVSIQTVLEPRETPTMELFTVPSFESAPALLNAAAHLQCLMDVQSLHLSMPEGHARCFFAPFRRVLNRMIGLRHLSVSRGFLDGIGVRIYEILFSNSHANLPFPNLSTLTLHNFGESFSLRFHDVLLFALEKRKEKFPQNAVRRVSMFNCSAETGYLEMRDVVPIVEMFG